jgi:hypothetical protein
VSHPDADVHTATDGLADADRDRHRDAVTAG